MSSYTNWSKEALIARILSLEANLSPKKVQLPLDQSGTSLNALKSPLVPARKPKPIKKIKPMDFSRYATRRVAIKFAYIGWNYHGLAYQKEGHRTVEYEILKAFHKTKCIPSIEPVDCNFSRCGRTDADVSAMAQVISLDLRSVLPKEEHTDSSKDSAELDYLKILNSNLPADILAYQICLNPPPDFDARFSCTGRHYHYYFDGSNLDLEAMQAAASKFVGEHDFRNFCKIDGSKQITNFRREVKESEIKKNEEGLCYLNLRGTAFLWNQVRSIMAILLLIGEGLESVDLVDKLLDTTATPRRPAYEIAWGVPLVLYNCEFPPHLKWHTSRYTTTEQVHNIWYEMLVKQSMTNLMIQKTLPFTTPITADRRVNTGQGIGRRCGKYTAVMKRPKAESPEVVNQKWLDKRAIKEEEESSS